MKNKPKKAQRVTKEEILRVQKALAGRIGGSRSTEKKARAVRLNGLKGGRPKKAQLEMRLEP